MLHAIDYAQLPTEQHNPRSRHLDCLSTAQLLRLMNAEDATVARAVSRARPQIARAVSLIVASLRDGGRLFFLGAGTSGRLGIIEAAECPPTFHTPPSLVQAIIAGGRGAVFRSREGAEDDRRAARAQIQRRVRAGDAVVGIAASGVTPFVMEGLKAARARGTSTVLVTCDRAGTILAGEEVPQAAGPAANRADVVIAAPVGPEIISGSTRLKAGTATKLILNMLTVATMVRLGKVHGHRMVDVRPTSRKLRARAAHLVEELGRVPAPEARRLLRLARGHTKLAIVMAARRVNARAAQRLLTLHNDMLRPLLQNSP